MAVSIRTGGNWYAANSGALRIRYAGNWQSANGCYVKIGGVGAGYWYDSGYRGYPAVPSTPWVTGWDYSNVNVGWSAGGGGAPVAYYQLQRLDVNGNQMNLDNYGGGASNNYAINWDTRYQFRVRAVSTGGLVSDWSGMLRVGIGHPQQDTYGYVAHTRGWSAHTSGQFGKDNLIVVTIPSSVTINAVHWINMRTPQSGTLNPNTTRDINWILNGADAGPIRNQLGVLGSGNLDYAGAAIGINGNNGRGNLWGVVPRGSGWSAVGNVTYMLWVDDFWFDGTETYQNWELTSSIPAQGNYYW